MGLLDNSQTKAFPQHFSPNQSMPPVAPPTYDDTMHGVSTTSCYDAEDAQDLMYDKTADTSHENDETAERAIDKDLEWTARKPNPGQQFRRLERPVVVPQVAPGLVSLFQRAWAPELISHDVHPEEWMQFIDHLNVCKTGSPPLQVLNLAGNVVGFVPNHWAQLAGTATNMVSVGGMVAISKIRVTRYLKRANAEYFAPRGLVAMITKQSNIHEITGQPFDAPKLAPIAPIDQGSGRVPDIIERRMQAFQGSVAYLEYDNVPVQQKEQTKLDQMTAKMNAMKANRGKKKDDQGHEISKHQAKVNESRAEAEEKAQKIRRKAEKELAKHPKRQAKIEREMEKDLKKLEKDAHSDEEKSLKKSGKGGGKADKKVSRLMFITVQNLDDYLRQQGQVQSGNTGI